MGMTVNDLIEMLNKVQDKRKTVSIELDAPYAYVECALYTDKIKVIEDEYTVTLKGEEIY